MKQSDPRFSILIRCCFMSSYFAKRCRTKLTLKFSSPCTAQYWLTRRNNSKSKWHYTMNHIMWRIGILFFLVFEIVVGVRDDKHTQLATRTGSYQNGKPSGSMQKIICFLLYFSLIQQTQHQKSTFYNTPHFTVWYDSKNTQWNFDNQILNVVLFRFS